MANRRAAFKGVITKLIKKATESDNQPQIQIYIQTIREKLLIIEELNQQVQDDCEPDRLEEEIINCELYSVEIIISIADLEKLLQVATPEHTGHQEQTETGETTTAGGSATGTQQVSDPNSFLSQFDPFSSLESRSRSVLAHNASAQTAPAPTRAGMNYNVRLPRLDLPTFEGSPTHWQSFWDSFSHNVHLNGAIPPIEKFTRLRKLLEGDALSCINGFSLTADNYQRAVELLLERFGQKHLIVQAHMSDMVALAAPSDSLASLQSFYDQTESHIRGLEALGEHQQQFGSLLVPIIITKLPPGIRQNLARANGGTEWSLHSIRSVLKKELEILRAGTAPGTTDSAAFLSGTRPSLPGNDSTPPRNNNNSSPNQTSCVFCNGPHWHNNCTSVKDAAQRIAIVTKARRCFNCLSTGHGSATCRSKNRCKNCNGKHHTAICRNRTPEVNANLCGAEDDVNDTDDLDPAPQVGSFSVPVTNQGVLLSTSITKVKLGDSQTEANILFDLGAQRSFVADALLTKLGFKPQTYESINLSGIESTTSKYRRLPKAEVKVLGQDGATISVHALALKDISAPLSVQHRQVKKLPYLNGISLAHPVDAEGPFTIDLLIAADHYWDFVEDETIRGNGPVAIKSKLGYLLSGPLQPSGNTTPHNSSAPQTVHTGIAIVSPVDTVSAPPDLTAFWELEAIGISSEESEAKSPSEEFRQQYQDTCLNRVGNKYIARLPFKDSFPDLPTNFRLADRRTRNMIKRLDRPTMKLYDQIIRDQERRDFIERVDPHAATSERVHYIPHHPVIKDSETTPIRIVYDCSARMSKNFASLNDCLYSTPPVYNAMTHILTTFRLQQHGVISDIEKAFLNVQLHPDDRDATRFLWLSDPSDVNSTWDVMRFKSVPFGMTCSPFILDATLRKHLAKSKGKAAKIMLSGLYVDNIITSFSDSSTLVGYYEESRRLLKSAGFNLRSWRSTYEPLNRLADAEGVLSTSPTQKVLGHLWNTLSDQMTYPAFKKTDTPVITKSEVASQTAKIYDPLGFLSPVTIRAKIFLQKLWQVEGLEWESAIPESLFQEWHELEDDLQLASQLTFPRRLFIGSPVCVEKTNLHVFVDSSTKAYGASVYLTFGHESALLMAKSRVAPLKQLTLPRLELMAALLGSRLLQHVQQVVASPKTYLWSDSQITLAWLASTKRLDLFTRNRVAEIKRRTPETEYMYCPTDQNPADLLTRGIAATKLLHNSLWMKGPSWLTYQASWPTTVPLTTTSQLIAIADAIETDDSTQEEENRITSLIRKVSDPARLLRIVARVLRFVNAARHQPVKGGTITADEIQVSEKYVTRSVQTERYSKETEALKANRKTTLSRQLILFLDEDEILRSAGRIHNSELSPDAKFPILLPPSHPYTNAVIRKVHAECHHMGLQATLAATRERFWIPKGGQVVKSVLHKCVPCKKHHGRSYAQPPPPPLPKIRVQEAPPFSITGIDFSGAIQVRNSVNPNTTHDAYFLLLTCAVTRSVHLEPVSSMSLESFMLALRRFIARRGRPTIIMSDNAKTFEAADRTVRKLLESERLQNALARDGIEWRFIPKRAPWFGFWERLVGVTKSCLKSVLGRRNHVTFESFSTILAEVEATVNNRPLTKASADPRDLNVLTPAHLLHGRRFTLLPLPIDESEDPSFTPASFRQYHDRLATTLEMAWKRFSREYLTALREYHRADGSSDTKITVGDIVLIHHECPRDSWKTAVVENLHLGQDGRIRSADIRTNTGRTNRPIAKLYPLEVRSTDVSIPRQKDSNTITNTQNVRPRRAAADDARRKIKTMVADYDSSDDEF